MTAQQNWDPIAYTRLRITLTGGSGPWSVPIDYYRLLRASVYQLLRRVSPELSEFLHTSGFSGDFPAIDWRGVRDLPAGPQAGGAADRFKLFCFSSLIGEGSLRQGRLWFTRPVTWFFATPLRFIAEALTAALDQTGAIRLGRVDLKVTEIRPLDEPADARTMTAALLSPLVISATTPAQAADSAAPTDTLDPSAIGATPAPAADAEQAPAAPRRRRYLTREDGIIITEARLRTNLLAKHRALYGVDPADPEFSFLWAPALAAWPTPDRPTRLIRLSGPGQSEVRVRGNLGAVTLTGTPELLRLALHAGLGQHNASGMGFLLPESESQLLRI